MRDISPEKVKLATLTYRDDPQGNRRGYYVYIEFTEPIKLDDWDEEPVKELYTLCHSAPESACKNFENLFSKPSEAEKVKKRTLIDACGFVL